MKTNITMTILAACGVLAFSAGCNKNESAAPAAPKDTQTPAGAAAVPSQQTAEAQQKADAAKAAEAAKAEATKQQAAAEKLAADKLAQEQTRIRSLIDSAKILTGQNKYAEALKVLGELANLKLTPEQQALADGLKKTAEEQAAKAAAEKVAGDASKAIGGALGDKK